MGNPINLNIGNGGSQVFNPFPIYMDNTIFIVGSLFNGSVTKFVIIKK